MSSQSSNYQSHVSVTADNQPMGGGQLAVMIGMVFHSVHGDRIKTTRISASGTPSTAQSTYLSHCGDRHPMSDLIGGAIRSEYVES